MKWLLGIFVLMWSLGAIAQSKKQQIETLKNEIHSLKVAQQQLMLQLKIQESQIKELNDSLKLGHNDKERLYKENKTLKVAMREYIETIDSLYQINQSEEEKPSVVTNSKRPQPKYTFGGNPSTAIGGAYTGYKVLKEPDFSFIEVKEDGMATFEVKIDALGNVVGIKNAQPTSIHSFGTIELLKKIILKDLKYYKNTSKHQYRLTVYKVYLKAEKE